MHFVTLNPIDSFVLKLHYRAATVINELFGISNFTVAHAWFKASIAVYLAYLAATIAWIVAFNSENNPGFTFFTAAGGGAWILLGGIDLLQVNELERGIQRFLSTDTINPKLSQILRNLAQRSFFMLILSILGIYFMIFLWGIEPIGLIWNSLMICHLEMLYFARCIGLPGKKGRVQSLLEKAAFALNPRRLAPKPTLG